MRAPDSDLAHGTARHGTVGAARAPVMTRTIHQLYCTHCTYGTSALHRHTGNVRTQPFEYSTRKGSVEQSLSHQTFQRIEKQFFRGIPLAGDAPVEVRRRDANDAPWRRLVYSPSVDGMRMLANVCYRSTDTAGRLGSYFAHVLYEEHSSNPAPWNPVDCLKLWGASFWETADTDVSDVSAEALEKSFVLKKLDGLTQPGYGAVINDEVLRKFLEAPADETAPDSDRSGMNNALIVFPTRWRRKTADERSRLLTNLLHAVLELDLESQERLTIAVEPGVAALLFYGIVRLLPPEGLVQQLSFSTFESHFDKPATVLTAHDFADPKATDLLPDTRARGFAINTYKPATNPKFRNPESQFANMMVQTFIRDGAAAVDRVLSQMTAAGGMTRDDYESLASVHQRVLKSLDGEGASPDQLTRMSKVEKQFAGRILADRLASASDDAVKSLAGRAAYLSTLDLISGVANDQAARQAEKRLVQVLPARKGVRNAFFSLPKLSSSLKVWWLKSYLKQKGQFPQDCHSLWFDEKQPNIVLSELLRSASATIEQVAGWRASVPPEYVWCYAAALASAVQHDSAKWPLLISEIERLDDDYLCKLLDKASGRADTVLKAIDDDDSRFTAHLIRFNDRIRTAPPDKIVARVETLLAISLHLPLLKKSLDQWDNVRMEIKRCEQYAVATNGRTDVELESVLSNVLKAVAAALSNPVEVAPIDIDVRIVEPLLRTWLGPKQHELCQRSMALLPKLQLDATKDTALCAFLAGKHGSEWLRKYPAGDTSLPVRLRAILDGLPEFLSTLPERLPILIAAQRLLGKEEIIRVRRWKSVLDSLNWLKLRRAPFASAEAMTGEEVAREAENLAPWLESLLRSHVSYDTRQRGVNRLVGRKYIQDLSNVTIGDNTLLECDVLRMAIERAFEKSK